VKSRDPRHSTVSKRRRHSTVSGQPPVRPKLPPPPRRSAVPTLTLRSPKGRPRARRAIGRVVDDEDTTLVDVLDNLLDKGVLLNAEVILALANVDLIYLRLSALLCGAARVLPRAGR
jgi:gas vesicle protein GvpA/GvpJ/GvpM family